MLDAKLELFCQYVQTAMDKWQVPGLFVSVVKDNEIVLQQGFGISDLSKQEVVTDTTLFPIGSITKSFTATAIAHLVDHSELDWFDPVASFLPDFFLYDSVVTADIRIQDLLFHNSGLASFSSSFLGFIGFAEQDIIHKLRYLKPVEEFRSQFQYHNGMYLVAGKVIEAVSQMSWADYLRKHILTPLKMPHTMTVFDVIYADDVKVTSCYGDLNNHKQIVDDKSWLSSFAPAGGLYSNAQDLSQWLLFNLHHGKSHNQQIVSAANMAKLFTPHITISYNPIQLDVSHNVDTQAYGLGWYNINYHGHAGLEHVGGVPGGSSLASFFPEQGFGIALACNTHAERLLLSALRLKLLDIMFDIASEDYSELFHENKKEIMRQATYYSEQLSRREKQVGQVIKGRFVGTFDSDFFGEIQIELQGDEQLVMILGPCHHHIRLKVLAPDCLQFDADDEIALMFNTSQLFFSELREGCYQRCQIVLYADHGFGQVVKIDEHEGWRL